MIMMRLFIFGTLGIIISFVSESSAQFWGRPNNRQFPPRPDRRYIPYRGDPRNNGFQPENQFPPPFPFLNNFQLPPDVSVSEAEWVCRNPKTGDMMIIAADDSPTTNGDKNQWNSRNFTTLIPPTSSEAPYTQPPPPPTPDNSINDNGDGMIDIRLGDKRVFNDQSKQT